MTALTRETVEAMLAGATPGPWVASNHPGDWGLGGSWTVSVSPHDYDSTIAEIPYQAPYCLGEKQSVKDKASAAAVSAALIAAAPDLAAALLAAWDREAKLREVAGRFMTSDGPPANARFIAWAREAVPALAAERDALREALAFYADPINYHGPHKGDFPAIDVDNGETARKALKGQS